jgi:carboxyl-terminal processing protease
MFTRKSLVILLILTIGGGVFYAVRSSSTKVNPNEKYAKIMQLVGEMLEDAHYSPRSINDRFSKDVLKKYLKRLDPEKIYFLASDMEKFKAIENNIDDEIKGAELKSFFMINEVYKKRVTEVSVLYKTILSKPFDFSINEKYVEVTDQTPYPKSLEIRQDLWRKKLKYMVLDKYVELSDIQEKRPDTSTAPVKSPKELEKEARAKVEKVYNRIFDRLRNRLNDDDDRFHWLVNEIAMTMDPHTNYYGPVDKRSFDEDMNREFYGIGASLFEEEGNIKIATIVAGSPAQKSGEIQVGDYILKVAQGDQEPQDLTGFDVPDAVKIIRGKKDTEVRLTLKKSDGSIKTVRLIREKISIDEGLAKSAVINDADGLRIGYIYLPEFYANFQDPNGARCAVDVAKEIKKLKDENVSGIILDLRNNGGGSLMDVVQMVGFFIDEGPVVQVKSKNETPTILRDREKGTLWDGPLTVMVNEFSASASEIFAAAIQDYQRGIVVGSTSTYGKGTVQRNMELDKTSWLTGNPSDLGSVKMTIQKFYRINGGSTQLRGVIPDVIMPDQYEYLKMREKDEMYAMEWDEITPAFYTKWKTDYDQNKIIAKSQSRLAENAQIIDLKKNVKNMEIFYENKSYTLTLSSFKSEKKSISESVKAIDTLLKLKEPLTMVNLTTDLAKINADSLKMERNTQFLKYRKSDMQLGETVQIMRDMMEDARTTAGRRKK